jgi:SAM-dependent methyltransferase
MMLIKPDTMAAMFQNGIKRPPGYLLEPIRVPGGTVLNLGSGNAPIEGATNLDRPDWNAPYLLEYQSGTVESVHMHHFLEHLDADDARQMLIECERVLKPGGVIYLTVPHAMSAIGYQAPDHRTYWTEEGLQDTFYSAGYDSAYGHKWMMDIVWMMVGGVRFHNLCVMAQIAKWLDGEPYYDSPWRRES